MSVLTHAVAALVGGALAGVLALLAGAAPSVGPSVDQAWSPHPPVPGNPVEDAPANGSHTRSAAPASCEADLMHAIREARDAQEQLEKLGMTDAPWMLGDWTDKFASATANPAAAPVAEDLLERTLETLNRPADYELECRGDICQADIVTETEKQIDYFDAVQEQPAFDEGFAAIRTERPTPAVDSDSKKGVWKQRIWLHSRTRAQEQSHGVLRDMFARFVDSPAVAECESLHSNTGELQVLLTIDESATLSATVGGSLAAEPLGICFVASLDSWLKSTRIDVDGDLALSERFFEIAFPRLHQ